jgi:hypothetical protein
MMQVHVGFGTGIPRVGNFNTVPVPVYTVPVSGTGTYRTVSAAVSYETRGVLRNPRYLRYPRVICITNYDKTTNSILLMT